MCVIGSQTDVIPLLYTRAIVVQSIVEYYATETMQSLKCCVRNRALLCLTTVHHNTCPCVKPDAGTCLTRNWSEKGQGMGRAGSEWWLKAGTLWRTGW